MGIADPSNGNLIILIHICKDNNNKQCRFHISSYILMLQVDYKVLEGRLTTKLNLHFTPH